MAKATNTGGAGEEKKTPVTGGHMPKGDDLNNKTGDGVAPDSEPKPDKKPAQEKAEKKPAQTGKGDQDKDAGKSNVAAGKGTDADDKEKKSSVTFLKTKQTVIEGNPIIQVGDQKYEIVNPKFRVPGFGEFTNIEAATNEKVILALIEMGSKVLKEVF